MINWKRAAKQYRQAGQMTMDAYLTLREKIHREQAVSDQLRKVVVAGIALKTALQRPKTPFVELVFGKDAEVENAQNLLVKTVEEFEKFIQTYSQIPDQNATPDQLDNSSVV